MAGRGVGFTGTSAGITTAQHVALREQLRLCLANTDLSFHHGDCVGADASAHGIALALNLVVHAHPPSDPKLRAFCEGASFTHVAKPYLVRNKDIVDSARVLIACPKTRYEELRSGTWSTVRYARKTGVPVMLVYPDGSVVRSTS